MHLDIPPGDFDAYIFDLDGTLIDSMPAHFKAWEAALKRHGLKEPLDEDLFYSFGGIPTDRVAELLRQHYRLDLKMDEVMTLKEELFLTVVHEVETISEVADFAKQVHVDHPVA